MDAAVIVFVLIALAVGGLIGWLIGSRDGAARAKPYENLRLQLDEVVKERDSNRAAAQELAALKAGHEEREKSFQQQIEALKDAKESLSRAIPRDRQQVTRRGAQDVSRAGRREVQPGRQPCRVASQILSGEAADDRKGARRPLCRTARSRRTGPHGAGAGSRRDPQPGQCAARVTQGARPLGRTVAQERARTGGVEPYTQIFKWKCQSRVEDGRLRPDILVAAAGRPKAGDRREGSLNAYLDACDEVDEAKREACFRAHVSFDPDACAAAWLKAYWGQFGDALTM